MIETVLFWILAAAAVTSAALVIVQRNAVTSAIYLIITLLCLAGIYLLLQAPFISVIQVLVYAGAVMVLFLFVIMLLNPDREKPAAGRVRIVKIAGIVLGVALLVQLGSVFVAVAIRPSGSAVSAVTGNTETVARLLFTDYLLPFEITSVLLLAAMIGAIVTAKREL